MLATSVQTPVAPMTRLYWDSVPSPMGECVIMANETGICWLGTPGTSLEVGLSWAKYALCARHIIAGGVHPAVQQAAEELQRYFAGEHVQFSCPLDLHGTPFQVVVWQQLTQIPYGETCSYGEIARIIGRPKASRAVGAANGANPIAIIVPCHRVIGSNGALVGYGGGLDTKSWLLDLEQTRH